MKIMRTVVIGFTLCAASIYNYVTYHYPTYSWKQKLTVTLETPQGEVSGATVVRVTWEKAIKFLPDMPGVRVKVSGEAAVVELPDGRYLFALLTDAQTAALRVFAAERMMPREPMFGHEYLPATSEVRSHLGETKSLTPGAFPTLALVADPDDPASISEVHSEDIAGLGLGYRLKAINISIGTSP
ncbi:hypothetical protein [Neorhizobium tomejilense]|uniref:hypothetical protein n=1 Tax=Neorhizobium tomejilense TaxID=2093828 RepID=UPI000CF8BBFE|nr:hypothetical protein [Neorhizobium tomejilense]